MHGSTETRVRYEESSVNAPSTCNQQIQSRACDNGDWENWTGTFSQTSCVVYAQCGTSIHGSIETRVRYETLSVNAPASCSQETQSRICADGHWADWSGTYLQSSCTVYAQCGSTQHGITISRTRYLESSVNAPETCLEEIQMRTCDDGSFTTWSGSYAFASCDVFAQCGTTIHGEVELRTRYETSSVNAPTTCTSEVIL